MLNNIPTKLHKQSMDGAYAACIKNPDAVRPRRMVITQDETKITCKNCIRLLNGPPQKRKRTPLAKIEELRVWLEERIAYLSEEVERRLKREIAYAREHADHSATVVQHERLRIEGRRAELRAILAEFDD